MPDLFDFWSSQTIGTDLKPADPKDPFLGISNINTSTDFKLQLFPTPLESKEQATKDLFELQLDKVLNTPSTNAPLYTYGDLEARRYDKDGKQFTPGKLITGFDIEDLYSKNQSASEQWFNVGVKTAANLLGTFSSAFLSIPKQIDLARSGRQDDIIAAFTEDSMPGWIQNSLMALEDKFPNYYTQWERDHPYMSAAAPLLGQAGFVNFWGDKVLKNLAFSVGALGAGAVQSAAIEYVTGTLGTPLAIAKLGSTISRIVPNLFRGFRNLAKVSQSASAVDDVIGVARVGEKFDDAVRTAAAAQKIGKVGKLALTSYLTAQGEAYIEGFHTYHQVREDYYKKLLNGEIDPKEAANIEGYAQDAGRLTTKINIPILVASNLFQFPRLLGVKAAGDDLIEKFLSMQTTNQGWKVVKDYTKKKAVKNFFYESAIDTATEAGQEGFQAIVSGAIHDYYMDKFSPVRNTYEHYITEQLKDDELYQEMFLGGLTGFLMSGPVTYRKYFSGANARLDKAIEHMTPVVEKFNEHIRGAQAAVEIVDLESDEGQQQLAKLKSMFNMVAVGRKTGTYDMVMDSIRDLKTMDIEEINTAFNRKFKDNAERNQYVDTMISEMEDMNASIDATDTVFGENPYKVDGKLKQKLKAAFNVKEDNELNNIQAYLFNEFKTTMAFNAVRTKRMAAQYDNYVEGLKSAGIGPQGIEYLINFARGDKKVMEPYRAYKATQLNALQSELEYLKEMQSKSKGSTVEGATSADYQKKIEAVQEKINMTTKNMAELEKLAKPLTRMTPENQEETKDTRQQILDILVREEIPITELLEYQTEREKQIKEIKKTAEEAAETVKTKEEYDAERGEPTKAADNILDTEIDAAASSSPPSEEPVAKETIDNTKWRERFKEGTEIKIDGYTFTVDSTGTSKFESEELPVVKLSSNIPKSLHSYIIYRDDKYYLLINEKSLHPLIDNSESTLPTKLGSYIQREIDTIDFDPKPEETAEDISDEVYSDTEQVSEEVSEQPPTEEPTQETPVPEATEAEPIVEDDIEAKKADIENRRPTSYIENSKDKKSPLETFRNEAKREWGEVLVITGDRMRNLHTGIKLFVEAYPEYNELLDRFIEKENGAVGITNNNLSFVLNTLKKLGITTENELANKINAKYDEELARELYKEMKAGKIVTDMTPAEQQVAGEYITEELRKSVDAELAASEQKTVDSIQDKKADIENRRQEELDKKQKFTINRGNKDLEQAPEISFSEIDVEKVGLDFDNNEVDKVKVLELRGRNTQGQRVGTVRIQGTTKEGQPFDEQYEVFFNDDKINAKYDAEYIDKVKKGEFTKQQAKDALSEIGRLTPELEKQIDTAELAALEKSKKKAQPQQPTLNPGQSSVTIGTEEFSLEEIKAHDKFYFVKSDVTSVNGRTTIYYIKDGIVHRTTLVNKILRVPEETAESSLKNKTFKQVIVTTKGSDGAEISQKTISKPAPIIESIIQPAALVSRFLEEAQIPSGSTIENDLIAAINNDLIEISCK